MGKNIYPTLSIPQLPVVLCVGLRPPHLCPVHLSVSFVSVFVQLMCRQSCWWDFVCVPSDIPRIHSCRENSLFFWLLESFCPSSAMILSRLCVGVLCSYISWDCPPQLCILIALVFCNGLCRLQSEVSLIRGQELSYWLHILMSFVCGF